MEPSVCLHKRSYSVVVCGDPRERKGKEFVNNDFIGKIAINVSDIPTQVPLDSPLAPECHCYWTGDSIMNTCSKVYLSPRLWYLRVNIIEAQDMVVPGDKNRNLEVYVKGTLGNVKLRTRVSADKSLNRRWNEDLMFVAAEPFYDHLVLTVVDKNNEEISH
ncbi:hypothetical protein J1N35_010495 [Gossypium stocksii]|uniref:C2 domain-containing protein n=1 Tax=Gossypium stocksii TaxID=47602 RepID=A0A9D3W174_9ROSI|nr:hypothetical protein J1N35_010495 [Gossypium stocksii]